MKILVTGGAGFIGSHLVERLLELDHQVVVIDNFDSFYDPKIKEENLTKAMEYDSFKLFRADIIDKMTLETVFSKNSFEIIIHLAAKAGVRSSIADPVG